MCPSDVRHDMPPLLNHYIIIVCSSREQNILWGSLYTVTFENAIISVCKRERNVVSGVV